ncbi:hypothetical protein N657DRAFT_633639 [Parathielavia appendiculata]|uniref:Uncharacterized protein n=1 Tax=Parathielavia appendiculata TaxID=2587402 RepID=A0AAN6Z3U8_9PEZI|nr:hypothetical protein N657DRAFT_633639 [Parathielavia appendiculata]
MPKRGSAAVSSVASQVPTANMFPQNPPRERRSSEGQSRKQPTTKEGQPVHEEEPKSRRGASSIPRRSTGSEIGERDHMMPMTVEEAVGEAPEEEDRDLFSERQLDVAFGVVAGKTM